MYNLKHFDQVYCQMNVLQLLFCWFLYIVNNIKLTMITCNNEMISELDAKLSLFLFKNM